MREIKFRAWDGHTKSFFDTPDTHYLPTLEVDDKGIMTIKTRDDSYELMQYTGLKDKNGKEIYEGDILKVRNWIGKIVWSDSGWFLDNNKWLEGLAGIVNFKLDCEVIGNIYENPELLKN